MTLNSHVRCASSIVSLLCVLLLWAGHTSAAQEGERPKLIVQVGHVKSVNDVMYSPDGNLLATAGEDGIVKLWDVRSRQLLNNLDGHSGGVRGIDFSRDSRLLASCGGQEVKIWEVKTGRLIHDLRSEVSEGCSVAFSPDGNLLASATHHEKYNPLKLWDVRSGSLVTGFGEQPATYSLSFALNGKVLITAGGKKINFWSVPDAKPLKTIDTNSYVEDLVVLPDGHTFATIDLPVTVQGMTITLWDIDGRVLRTLLQASPEMGQIQDLAFSPDAKTYAVAYWNDSSDAPDIPRVELRNFKSSRVIQKFHPAMCPGANALNFSPDGRVLVTSSGCPLFNCGCTWASLWDIASGKLLDSTSESADTSTTLAVSRDGKVVARSTYQNIQLFDAERGKFILNIPGQSGEASGMAFSPDGKMLVSVSPEDGGKIWSTSKGSLVRSFGTKDDELVSVAYSPDGRLIAAGGSGNIVQLIDAQSGTILNRLSIPRLSSVAFLPSSFLSAGFTRTQADTFYVNAVAFSPDGRTLAAGGHTEPPHFIFNLALAPHRHSGAANINRRILDRPA